MSKGDVVNFVSDRLTLRVKILDLFTYEGVAYAEVIPDEFPSVSREIPVAMLQPLN